MLWNAVVLNGEMESLSSTEPHLPLSVLANAWSEAIVSTIERVNDAKEQRQERCWKRVRETGPQTYTYSKCHPEEIEEHATERLYT